MEGKHRVYSVTPVFLFVVWLAFLVWIGIEIQQFSANLCAVAFLGMLFVLYFYTRVQLEHDVGVKMVSRVDIALLLTTLISLALVTIRLDGSVALGNTDAKITVVSLCVLAGIFANYCLTHQENETPR